MTVSGEGALSVRVNGEIVQTLAAGDSVVRVALSGSGSDEISFAYAGAGFADVGRLRLERGLCVIVR